MKKKEEITREIKNIISKKCRLARKFRNCCGLKRNICDSCLKIHQQVLDLNIEKADLYEKRSKFK